MIQVGQLNGLWGVFKVKENGTCVCLTPQLYRTEIEALRAYAKTQEQPA